MSCPSVASYLFVPRLVYNLNRAVTAAGNTQCINIIARKRSLGQGNVFTRVCHSVHRGEGALCMISLPVWLPGPMFLPGGLCLWSHVPSGRVSITDTPFDRDLPGQRPPCTVRSGWYASYWNAFLLTVISLHNFCNS